MSSTTALEIRPFDFQTSPVRIVVIDGNPWFIASDVAKVLGYRDAEKMTRMLDDDEADTHNVGIRSENGVEQTRAVTIISESGMYACILKSRKPEAKPFRKWVTSEVLPTIRKTGQYTVKPSKSKKALPGGLTLEQQDTIKEMVKARVEQLPADKRAKAAITLWSALKAKFGVTYKAIPPDQIVDAISLVARIDLEGEYLPRETMPLPHRTERMENPNYPYAREQLANLIDWGKRALPPRVEEEFWLVCKELERALISGWTEMDEALLRMAVATAMLKRWKNGQ